MVTSSTRAGCTFFEWSIHYLSGATKYYNVDLGSIDLTENPLSTNFHNAHQHFKNHPLGLAETLHTIKVLNAVHDHDIVSMYPLWISHYMLEGDNSKIYTQDSAEKILNLTGGYETKEVSRVISTQKQDLADVWDVCSDNGFALIFIKNRSYPLYDRSTTRTPGLPGKNGILEYFLKQFFKEELTNSGIDLHTSAPWDIREFVALNIDSSALISMEDFVDFKKPHYYIDARALRANGFGSVKRVMDGLQIAIDSERVDPWYKVYHNWQEKQSQALTLSWDIDHICEAIAQGLYYDLEYHNLTLWDEAMILSMLLRKFNLNIKGWGLEKFPRNTLDLHSLLEPNIHQFSRTK